MPAIGSQTGRSAAAEKKIKRAKRKRIVRPAPVSQPGPFTDAERKKVARNTRSPKYQRALQKARVHGPATQRGRRSTPAPMSDAETRKSQELERRRKARIAYLRATRPTGSKLIKKILASAAGHPSTSEVLATGRGKNASPKILKRELEGRGILAGTLQEAGKGVAKLQKHDPGRPPQTRLTAKSKSAAGGTKIAENLAKDVVTFPAQAVPSVYVPAAAAYEAAKGDTSRAKQLGKDLKENDPVYNTVAAGVEAAKGNEKAAKSHLEKAKKAATEHPGLTALEVAGVKGATGRTISRGLRGGGRTIRRTGKITGSKKVEAAGEKIRKAGSTERASRQVPGTNIVETRAHSRDAFKKLSDVNADRVARKKSKQLHKQADRARAHGHEAEANKLRQQAHNADPDRFGNQSYGGVLGYGRIHVNRAGAEIRRQVDEDIQAHEDIRRLHRAETVQKTTRIVKGKVDNSGKGKIQRVARVVTRADRGARLRPSEQGVLNLVTQRIIKADKEDIRARIKELEDQQPHLDSKSKLRQNKVQIKAMRKVLNDPKADMGRLEAAAKAYQAHTAPIQRKLSKLKVFDTKQMRRRVVIPYAVRRMGAKFDAETGKIVDANGAELSTKRIIAHMEAHDESPAAFVTQAPNRRGALNFNIRSERAPGQGPKGTTGEATRGGTFDIHPDTLVEGAARGQGLVDATRHFRALVKRFGQRDADNKIARFKSKDAAMKAVREYMHDENGDPVIGAEEMVPIRLNAIGNTKAPLEGLLDDVNKLTTDQQNAILDSMKNAFAGTDGKGEWALIPRSAQKRILDHLNTQGGGGGLKTMQLLNTQFRKTVLSTSPTWLAGNLIEGGLRAALAHAGPRSWWTARQVIKRLEKLDDKAAEELMSRILGGGHFTSVDRSAVRRGAEQFADTDIAGIATALGKFWRAPGPKQAADLWHAYTEIVMRQLNGRFEKNVQMAMLGKALRQSPLMDQRVLKLQKKAYDEAARGLTNTPAQRDFGRQVDIMYGKYGKHSPAMKKAISTYTPFISWWLNSVNFVYRTLPRDHPAVTALIASAEQATEEWRKEHGLDQFIQGAAPLWLQGSIPLPGGGHLRASRYTPFGAFGDPTGTIAGQFTPAISSLIAAAQGRDWTGRELTVTDANGKKRKPNPLELGMFAGHAFLSETVPFLSVAERVAKEGPKVLNPLRATKAPEGKGSGRKVKRPTSEFGGSPGRSSGGSSEFGGGGSRSSGGGGGGFGG